MGRKPNSAAIVQDDEFDKVAKTNATDLTDIEGKDTGVPDEQNDSLINVPMDTIPVNIPLPCTVYMKVHGKILVFRRQGEKMNYKTALEMTKKGTNTLLIHKAFWQMFMKSLESMHLNESDMTAEVQAMHMRQLLLAYGQELEKKLKEPKKPMFDKLQRLAVAISEKLQADPRLVTTFLRPTNDPTFYFVNHSVNSAVYATLIGIKHQFAPKDIKSLTYATIVHDVGNLFLPKRILYKRSALTSDDEAIVQSHPRKGAEFLQSLQAPPEVVKAVLQHHERIDGKGYPEKLNGDQIHPFAKIIAIVDTFDSLTSNRPFRNRISTTEALKEMTKMKGAFDADLISFVEETADTADAAAEAMAKKENTEE